MKKGAKVRDISEGDKNHEPAAIIGIKNWISENYDIRRNIVTGSLEARKCEAEDHYKLLNENTVYIQLKAGCYKITMVDLMALLNSDFVEDYNPFLDYFENLPEPTPGTIEKFADHIETTRQEQFKHHFKKMLVRTIACALDERLFNKQCFTFVGRQQGTGKTSLCRYLVPPALAFYYTENFTNDKDGQIALTQNFLIGLDELSSLSRFELNQLKANFSRDRASIRHPFARKQTTEPRRASFIASTNEDAFLNDTTGSVRWLCFEIVKIDWAYRDIPIDDVWSEAYRLYKSGFEYNLTGQEMRENEQRNEQFQIVNPEAEYIIKQFKPGNIATGSPFYTATEIKDAINQNIPSRADLKSAEKVGKALISLGFEKTSRREYNKVRYGYYVDLL